MMLSLSPRFDLFKFNFPKDFVPEEIQQKYNDVLSKNSSVFVSCIDYLNESIQAVSFPGIDAETKQQEQFEHNSIRKDDRRSAKSLGKINVEPSHQIQYSTIQNPLEMITKEFKVTMRMNQGLYNYFMMYETFFYAVCKPINEWWIPELYIDILNDQGVVINRIKLSNLVFKSIDSLDFNYSQQERQMKTFDITLAFNNIDFDILGTYNY